MADFGEVWPPGFRFHPTDEELVLYYLKRKICGRRLKLDVIGEVDVYKWDPEELPGLSLLKNGDRLWFFFSPRDRKYPNGSRSNRATRHGYWKGTGKDRTISSDNRTVGLKKTLVFYKGRAPSGDRTDWVMHEYILEESELSRCQNVQDYYVLYKLFKKSGPGPKNGEQYGAPFKEEDWVDDELPQVSNYNDNENHVKQSDGIASTDMSKDKPIVRCTWDEIKEFVKQFGGDEPVPEGPDINHYNCALQQVVGEKEAQSTMTGLAIGKAPITDICKVRPSYGQQDMEGSMNFRWPTSQLQWNGVNNSEQLVIEEDFLELDDLLGSTLANDSGENMPQPAGGDALLGSELDNSQWGDIDGLSEFDLYYDAEMFHNEPISINQPTAHSLPDLQASQLLNSDVQEGKLPSCAMKNHATGDLCGGNFTPNAMESKSNENRSGKGVEGDDNWYTSSLWSFVESIPTTPASAADSALVSRTFRRMSSFTRLRLNPKTVTAAVAAKAASNGSMGGRMEGFIHLSFMGALFAPLFVLIGVFGMILLSTQLVKYSENSLHSSLAILD